MSSNSKYHHQTLHILTHSILIAGALVMCFPLVWMFLGSLKSYNDVSSMGFLPREWMWSNYPDAITMMNGSVPCRFDLTDPLAILRQCVMLRLLVNTIAMATFVVAGVLATGTLAAYAFAQLSFPGRNALFIFLLATMMIPDELTLIPNFILMVRLITPESLIQTIFRLSPDASLHNWIDTYYALIIPWTASAFTIFLFRQAFGGIPSELLDASLLDGASHLRFLWSVVLPLSKPVLITGALLTFLGSWNALMWPMLVTNSPQMRPIQAGLAAFISDAGMQLQLLLAASTMTIIPIVFLYLVLQRWFVEGIASAGMAK